MPSDDKAFGPLPERVRKPGQHRRDLRRQAALSGDQAVERAKTAMEVGDLSAFWKRRGAPVKKPKS